LAAWGLWQSSQEACLVVLIGSVSAGSWPASVVPDDPATVLPGCMNDPVVKTFLMFCTAVFVGGLMMFVVVLPL
jgi:hypothetical protein